MGTIAKHDLTFVTEAIPQSLFVYLENRLSVTGSTMAIGDIAPMWSLVFLSLLSLALFLRVFDYEVITGGSCGVLGDAHLMNVFFSARFFDFLLLPLHFCEFSIWTSCSYA